MTADRWRRIDDLFHRALALPSGRREAFLASACDGDEALRSEVASLLEAHEGAEDFLETPVVSRDPYVGATFKGRYHIERELGRGGIGVVYLARDAQLLAKPVVVKVLLDGSGQFAPGAWAEWLAQKFEHEVEALARIDHPGVVGVLDTGAAPDGRPFFVMQYIDGVSLRVALEDGAMPLDRAASILRQIGQALDAAHEKGVFHRDLKPENILLRRFGDGEEHVKIIDFGIAKVENPKLRSDTGAEMIAGTVAYMAPEQLRSSPASAATDVYAMGVIAFELVTGRAPFRASTVVELADAQRAGPAARPSDLRPDLAGDAERAILKALALDPADRFARSREFGDELARALHGSGEASRTTTGTMLMSTAIREPAAAAARRREPVGGAGPLDSPY
jgi:eukaryotic-like serine/threonine-protein kinase